MPLPLNLASPQDAISAAVEVARNLGVSVHEPVLLRSTNNTVAWLQPAGIVAKVSATPNSRLHTELQVGKKLSALGAPVVSPAPGLPTIVHQRGGFDITFWAYHTQSGLEPEPDKVHRALNQLHVALDQLTPTLKASLPSYMAELDLVRQPLADTRALPALSVADRELLVTTFDRLKAALDQRFPASQWSVIHGSPHAYNVLVVGGEPVFIDFETTCFGPREWDFAHLDSEQPSLQPELLSLCHDMVTIKTATLCVAEIKRGDMREHAEYHLACTREKFGPA